MASNNDVLWVLKTIRPDFAHISLNHLENSREEIIQLEEKLYIYLDQIIVKNKSKTILLGSAGTGKTILLRELRDRHQQTILLVCFNALYRAISKIFSKPK